MIFVLGPKELRMSLPKIAALWAALLVTQPALACELHPQPFRSQMKAIGSVPYWAGPGVSGAWFDPARDGEGVILQFLPDGRAIAIWFTYPAAGEPGEQAWLIGQDSLTDGPAIRFRSVIRPSGGRFGAGFDPAAIRNDPWGTMELSFADCNTATLSWSGPAAFGSGSRTLVRLSSIDESSCAGARRLTASGARAAEGLRSRSGAWYVPSRSGEGWIVEELPDGRGIAYWFTFDPDGRQAWTVGIGQREGNRLVIDDNRITRGTRFGTSFNAGDVERLPWGSLTLDFGSCGTATVSYASTVPGYGNGTREAARLTTIAGAPCFDTLPQSPVTGPWVERAQMPRPYPSELAATVSDGGIYAMGGFGHPRGFRRYDPATNTWTELPTLPGGRDHLSAFALGGRIYMNGGFPNGGGEQDIGTHRYDPALQTWEPVPEVLSNLAAGAATLHGTAFIGNTDGSLQHYDPSSAQVRRIPAADFTERDHSQTVAFLDEVWVIAGRSPETRSIQIYNPASGLWRPGPPLAIPRGGFAAASDGRRLLVAGGEVVATGLYTVAETEVLRAGAEAFEAGPALPLPVHGVAGAVAGGSFHVVSGAPTAGATFGGTGRLFALPLPAD